MKTNFLIPLSAGLALLCACGGRDKRESTDSAANITSSTKSTVRTNDTIQDHPKQVKTADIRFQVKDVRQTAEQVTALTTSYNGTVVHHLMRSVAVDSADYRKSDDSTMRVTVVNSSAEMIVRIPPTNMENFMNQVARLGIRLNNQRMDITDKSLEYLSTRLKLQNQKELVDRQKNETANKKDPDNLLAFKNNMVDQQINNRKTDDSVKNSVVVLNFYERNIVSKKMMANNDLSAYREPLAKRLAMSFENGWNIFTDILAGLANFWVLVPVGLGVWLGLRYYKGRKLSVTAKVD